MEYRINTIDSITYGFNELRCQKNIRPLQTSGTWYNPVYGWTISRSYRTEFTATAGVYTTDTKACSVDFYLCGPVDRDYYVVDVDRETGVPNLPIVAQATVNNPGASPGDEYGQGASASLNVGSDYGGTELAANEVYILFMVRTGASENDNAISASFQTDTMTDDSPEEEWYIYRAPWYDSVDASSEYSATVSLPQYNLLCFAVDNVDSSGNVKDGSWTVEVSAGANVVVYAGARYKWSSTTGVPSGQRYTTPGTIVRATDIPPTVEYIWIRFADGASEGNVTINISFMETQVETQWHAHVPTISMNGGSVLPASGSETWTSGLGEKEVLIYRFKLSENFAPTFSYSGSQSMWMCISTVGEGNSYVNSRTGAPEPSSAIRGSGNGTSFSVTASQTLTAGTWYYLFIEVSSGEAYSGQIVITYEGGETPPQPEPEWSYSEISAQTDIIVKTTRAGTIYSRTGIRLQVSFRFSGYASFSVSGSDASAYVYATSGDYGYSKTSGRPKDINGNEISDAVSTTIYIGSGHTYYVWVRGQTTSTAGDIRITITPPQAYWTEEEVGEKDITVTSESFIRTFELTVQQLTAYRFDLVFSRSATVQIYSVGSTETSDVRAYFSSVPRTFNRTEGRPESDDAPWEDTEPGNYNFNSGALAVVSGTTYYLWVRGAAADTTAHIWINIAGGGSSGNEKIWLYTNGQWVQPIVHDYISNAWSRMAPYDYIGNIWK